MLESRFNRLSATADETLREKAGADGTDEQKAGAAPHVSVLWVLLRPWHA